MATAQEANELKQQGAVEAAQNPESSVSAEDAERKIVEESKKVGIPAFSFDPNATLAEKRAKVKAATVCFSLPLIHRRLILVGLPPSLPADSLSLSPRGRPSPKAYPPEIKASPSPRT